MGLMWSACGWCLTGYTTFELEETLVQEFYTTDKSLAEKDLAGESQILTEEKPTESAIQQQVMAALMARADESIENVKSNVT